MKSKFKFIKNGFLLSASIMGANALAEVQTFRIHHQYQSTRAMGMGDAFNTIADDHSTLFYNPAGLAKIEDGEININVARAEVATGFIDLVTDISDAGDSTDAGGEVTKYVDLLETTYGENYYARLMGPDFIWSSSNWGIGFIPLDATVSLSPHRSFGPSFDVTVQADSTLAYGMGFDINKVKGLSVGATAKGIYRLYMGEQILILDLVTETTPEIDDVGKEGLTLDFDIGALYEIPIRSKLKPVASMVIRNLLDYGYLSSFSMVSDQAGDPPKLGRVMDLGAGVKFSDMGPFEINSAFEIRDMGHENWTFKKSYHLGAEFKWNGFSWLNAALRAGVNQGYITYGVSMNTLFFQLDYANYGMETGSANAERETRVHMLQASVQF